MDATEFNVVASRPQYESIAQHLTSERSTNVRKSNVLSREAFEPR